MKWKRKAVLATAMALCAVLPGCGASSGGGTLTVGVRDDIMNFSYLNPVTGNYAGLEIDLAYELAEALGYDSAEFKTVTPDNRKDTLLDGEVDCLIAAYSITDTRLENFDFSPAYYSDASRIMVENSSLITSMEELLNKKTGVLDGADTAPVFAAKLAELGLTQEEYTENFDAVTFVKFDSYRDMDLALEEGTIDAACMDGCIAKAYMNEDRTLLEETIGQEEYGVATQKGSSLSEKVSSAIQNMLDDGTIAELTDKWD